ncbi:MAG: YezD family protein [Terrimicrobiaceae bacterium]
MSSTTTQPSKTVPNIVAPSPNTASWLEIVNQQVSALRFGAVAITVHEGRVVQIETSVKVRFDKTP